MRTTLDAQTQVAELYEMLCNHGVILLPTKLGSALIAVTARGVNHLYNLKGRPKNGAPILKRLETEVRRGVYIPRSNSNSGVRPITPKYGAEPKELQVGRKFRSHLEITLDSSLVTAWQSLVPTESH